MEYCIAAANSPFAPPNCSSSMLPNRGSGAPTWSVYISSLTWWYMEPDGAWRLPVCSYACGFDACRTPACAGCKQPYQRPHSCHCRSGSSGRRERTMQFGRCSFVPLPCRRRDRCTRGGSFAASRISCRARPGYTTSGLSKMRRTWIISGIVFAIGMMRSQQTPIRTERFPQFDNKEVKVWKSVVLPDAPLTMHRHDRGRVIIALRGGTMKIVEQGGASQEHVWETGKAY